VEGPAVPPCRIEVVPSPWLPQAFSFYRQRAIIKSSRVDKTITIFDSLDELKTAELRDWQSLPAHQRLRAVSELTLALCRMKEPERDVRRIQRTNVCLQREKR
jgi:hypothetical protein